MNEIRRALIKAFLEAGNLKKGEYSVHPVEDNPVVGWDSKNKKWIILSHTGPGVFVTWEVGDDEEATLFFKDNFTIPNSVLLDLVDMQNTERRGSGLESTEHEKRSEEMLINTGPIQVEQIDEWVKQNLAIHDMMTEQDQEDDDENEGKDYDDVPFPNPPPKGSMKKK